MSDAVSGKAIVKALNGKADVHEAVGNISAAGELRAWAARIERGDFSITSPTEGEWKATSEFAFRLNDQLEAEVQRLRAALDGIRQYLMLIPNKTVSEQRTIEICNEALSTSTGAQQVREPVRWFAEQMEEKLRANDHKPHWSIAHPDYLIHRLFQEANELWRAMEGELTADEVIKEAADVANFAMMIADNARRINAPEKGGEGE